MPQTNHTDQSIVVGWSVPIIRKVSKRHIRVATLAKAWWLNNRSDTEALGLIRLAPRSGERGYGIEGWDVWTIGRSHACQSVDVGRGQGSVHALASVATGSKDGTFGQSDVATLAKAWMSDEVRAPSTLWRAWLRD